MLALQVGAAAQYLWGVSKALFVRVFFAAHTPFAVTQFLRSSLDLRIDVVTDGLCKLNLQGQIA